MSKDQVYATPQNHIAGFAFNDKVASVFSDMISRSVPGYDLTLEMLAVISQRYSQPNSVCYDIGSSLGASTMALARNANEGCRVIGVDNSEAMVSRANALLADTEFTNIDYLCADIRDTAFQPSSVISSNFTLQFISVADREQLLQRAYNALLPAGVLVLSEKIVFNTDQQSDTMIDLYHRFKQGRGYSELEVAQKRTALENVLIPETVDQHKQRLLNAGFNNVYVWFQCFNFCSLIAFK